MRTDGLIELPNGWRMFYDDPSHKYYRARYDGETWHRSTVLTGCSSLCKPYNYDSGKLLAWKERLTCEGVVELVNRHQGHEMPLWLYDARHLRQRLKEEGVTADDARDKKAALGTQVHEVLEGLAGVRPMPDVDSMPDAEKGYAQAVMRWWEARRPDVHQAEQFVYSQEHGFAGRFDLRANLLFEEEGRFDGLVDLKTSSFISPAYHVQLALYELAAKECGIGPSEFRMVLQVREDGSWTEVVGRATEEDALHAIAVYRGAARIEREAKAA